MDPLPARPPKPVPFTSAEQRALAVIAHHIRAEEPVLVVLARRLEPPPGRRRPEPVPPALRVLAGPAVALAMIVVVAVAVIAVAVRLLVGVP